MPGPRWRRAISDGFTQNLGYKAVAFALAIVLWIAASGEESAARYVDVRFVPSLDSGVHMIGRAPRLQALIEGPTRELLTLHSSPPAIRRTYTVDTPDHVRVTLGVADVDLPSGVSRLRVRDVVPHSFLLQFAVTRGAARVAVPNGPNLPNDSAARVTLPEAPSTSAAADLHGALP